MRYVAMQITVSRWFDNGQLAARVVIYTEDDYMVDKTYEDVTLTEVLHLAQTKYLAWCAWARGGEPPEDDEQEDGDTQLELPF